MTDNRVKNAYTFIIVKHWKNMANILPLKVEIKGFLKVNQTVEHQPT